MDPYITVITPVHNDNARLALCVRSVADQTSPGRQHVIQDTGSAVTIEPWLRSVPRVELAIERDDGMYDAINRGLGRARGTVWAWLNADEQYLPGALERVAGFFTRHPEVDVLVANSIVVDGAGRATCYRRAVLPPRVLIPHTTLPLFSCACFFSRRLIDAGVRFDQSFRIIGDSELFHRLRRRPERWAHLDEFVAAFTIHNENLGASPARHAELARWRARERVRHTRAKRLAARAYINARRVLSGSLRPRTIEYAIYTPASPDARTLFRATGLPGSWSGVAFPGVEVVAPRPDGPQP